MTTAGKDNSAACNHANESDNLSEALISLDNLEHNLSCIRSVVGNRCRIMGIVKANAYGHGGGRVAETLEHCGISDFGVANIHEAVELRRSQRIGHESRILAFAPPLPSHIEPYLQHGIDMTICDSATAAAAQQIAAATGKPLKVQVKIDTGMGRMGIAPEEAMPLFTAIDRSSHLELAGIYTHFAQSHEPEGFTRMQLDRFRSLTSEYEHATGRTVCKHAANSGAIVSAPSAWFDMVRPGILLYGYHPNDNEPTALPLRPVMQFQGRVIYIKSVPAGTTISYNRTWSAPGQRTIATIAAGYADGYHRSLSNRSRVFINGKAYPQIGTVTMDQIMIDLGSDTHVRPGDTAVLFGWDGPSAGELALTCGTISYELLCSVSRRVRRVYR